MGLVKLVLQGVVMRAIQKLTQTYLTLSLSHIAQNVGLPSAADAEAYILRCGSFGPRTIWRICGG